MNRNIWEAERRSSAFGIELHNQFYDKLHKASRAVLIAGGIATPPIEQAPISREDNEYVDGSHEAPSQFEQETTNSLFLTAATHLLPRQVYQPDTVNHISSARIETDDPITAQSLLESVVWVGGARLPHWILGYRYTDNAALVMPLAFEEEAYRPKTLYGRMVEDSWHYGRTFPYDAHDRATPPRGKYWMRFVLETSNAYTFHPKQKDGDTFESFATTDGRLPNLHQLADAYDADRKQFDVDVLSDGIYFQTNTRHIKPPTFAPRYYAEQGFTDRFEQVPSDVFTEYHVFEGLIRLMSRFNKGGEYLKLMRAVIDDSLVDVVLQQQRIPRYGSTLAARQFKTDLDTGLLL